LIKFTYTKAAELARELGKIDVAKKWEQRFSESDLEYPVDESSLLIAPGYPYEHSHHHFSHLLAFHPLDLLYVSHNENEVELIRRSIENCEIIESKNPRWSGYMFGWLGGMKARMFDEEGAGKKNKEISGRFCYKKEFSLQWRL